jgi:hypothetical protein
MKLRPLGKVLLDMEPLLEELVDRHELQHGEILALVDVWLSIHRPDCREQYVDGGSPHMKYGPKE